MTDDSAYRQFRAARDLLLRHDRDHEAAVAAFRWPRPERFNWATDWFDRIARGNDTVAVRVVDADRCLGQVTYAELSRRSHQVANWLSGQGLGPGSRLLLMLDNCIEVWEATIAAIRLGAVVIPTYTSVSGRDLDDRVHRGGATHVLTHAGLAGRFTADRLHRMCVGGTPAGWHRYEDSAGAPDVRTVAADTRGDDPLFVYFTSGTTSVPKMVGHTHASYPIGHLIGMYFNGLRPGDVHLNVAAPGWAKHAWSSFFGPLNAEATVVSARAEADRPDRLLEVVRREGATSLCAPPTVWRALAAGDLGERPARLREVTSVGEALNPETIDKVRRAWDLTVRDGYGQTEATAMIGNTPGSAVKPGSMGRPLPGYRIALLDPLTGRAGTEGEICVALDDAPVGIMTGYLGDDQRTAEAFARGWYHTGDIARADGDGYLTHLGRADDLFKAYGQRISPFELESVLVEHPMVAEAAVTPVAHPTGQAPKAFVAAAPGVEPSREVAANILRYTAERLAPHQQIDVLEFATLPKTMSGKIRRAELRVATGTSGQSWRRSDLLAEAARPLTPRTEN